MLIGLNTCGITEFFKIPVLCQHFIEHRLADNNISVIQFLGMHYGGSDANDKDDSRDMQLPFKNMTYHTVQIAFFQNAFATPSVFIQPVTKRVIGYKKDFYSWFYNTSLIKPPSLKA